MALMIPGSKLTGHQRARKTCFIGGLSVYGVGAFFALSRRSDDPDHWILAAEGVGYALMIPPIDTYHRGFQDIKSRAKVTRPFVKRALAGSARRRTPHRAGAPARSAGAASSAQVLLVDGSSCTGQEK